MTYRRNAAYVPRSEPPDGLAGGKRAGIERVEWVYLPDAQTALNALTTGELDIFEELPPDLFPIVRRNRNLRIGPQDNVGVQAIFRMNQAVPPFDNPRLRQAMRLLVDPAHAMPAYMTEPSLWRDCRSFYTCTSPTTSRPAGLRGFRGRGRAVAESAMTARPSSCWMLMIPITTLRAGLGGPAAPRRAERRCAGDGWAT